MARNIDLISTEFVIGGMCLLDTLEAIDLFGQSFPEYQWRDISKSENGYSDGRRVSIDRLRVSLDLTPVRTTVRQEYPSDMDVLPTIVQRAISYAEKPLDDVAYGFNADMSFATGSEPAFSLIARKFVSGVPPATDLEMIGGSVNIRLSDKKNNALRNVVIEPRFRNESFNRAYLSINSLFHGSIPTSDGIRDGFQQILREAELFAESLCG